jgi:cysteinyl-tRNA synthetase
MEAVKLYNTLHRTLETFLPIEPGAVRLYHCGPTVYWTQHIGNMRGMTMADLVVRTLRFFGYTVSHVRNYTDVGHLTGDNLGDADLGEDRMDTGARREGLTPKDIADKYIALFEHDTAALNILEPTFKPRATEFVPDMIAMVEKLLAGSHAYQTDLAVYFDVSTARDYTQLSGQNLERLAAGSGKAEVSDPEKKHPNDFALWFFRAGTHAQALQFWPSPFTSALVPHGEGFPGWHLECSVMSQKLLGNTIDIHMGGVEHIAIHHTNEIAQSEAATGVPFVHYWLHNEHLLVDNQKMAKSQGTGYSLAEVTDKGFDPLALRYFFLTAHYASKQNFTWQALQDAANGLQGLREAAARFRTAPESAEPGILADKLQERFSEALADDINVPRALAIAWEAVKSPELSDGEKRTLLKEFDRVLGLNLETAQTTQLRELDLKELPEPVQFLIRHREDLRAQNDFAQADAVRQRLEQAGYRVEDTPTGPNISVIL